MTSGRPLPAALAARCGQHLPTLPSRRPLSEKVEDTLDSSPSPPGSQPPTPSNARQGQPLHTVSREPRVCGFRVVEASGPSSPVHRQLGHTWSCRSGAGGRFFQQVVGLPFQEKRLPRSRPGRRTLRHRALRGDCREAPSQVRERPLHKGAAPVG